MDGYINFKNCHIENKITAKEFGDILEHRIEMVFQKGNQLQARVEVQDVKIHKLWQAYQAMGISMPLQAKKLTDPIRAKMRELENEEPYWEKYNLSNERLNYCLAWMKKENNPIEILMDTEKVVNDLLILLNLRWEIISEQLGLIVKQAQVSRALELSKADEYQALESALIDPIELQSAKESYMDEKMELMEQQFRLFQTEQEILDQMEIICDKRDRLFSISEELFLR